MARGAKVIAKKLYENGYVSDEFMVVPIEMMDPFEDPNSVADELNDSGKYPGLWFEGVYELSSGEVIPYPKKWV